MSEKEMTVRVADVTFGIRYRYNVLPAICEDYVVRSLEPEFWLVATDEEIEREQQSSEDSIDPGQAESAAIQRKLGEHLLRYDAFLLHAAVIEYEGIGYAFSAKSGVGKTTHIKLWRERFGDAVHIVNGDKPIIRFEDGKVFAYGTPWCGKERYHLNDRCELKNVCFVERANSNSIVSLSNQDALLRLFPQILLYRKGNDNLKVLERLDRFMRLESFYLLGCTPTVEAAETAYFGMNREKEV